MGGPSGLSGQLRGAPPPTTWVKRITPRACAAQDSPRVGREDGWPPISKTRETGEGDVPAGRARSLGSPFGRTEPRLQADSLPLLLAAPDSFKGTASALELCQASIQAAQQSGWRCDPCPLSDGGEGFIDALLPSLGAQSPREMSLREMRSRVTGPLGVEVEARWVLAGDLAMLESSQAIGLPLTEAQGGNDPVGATSRGAGELLVAAAQAGAVRALMGVGGSATTDGGQGAVEVLDSFGGLGALGLEVTVACDVNVGFLGALEFAPQKGASTKDMGVLRQRLEQLGARWQKRCGRDLQELPGAGAAGGLAGGLAAAGARLTDGFALVAKMTRLQERIRASDLVLTGEGCLDATSFKGKVVGGVLRLAKASGKPAVLVTGLQAPGLEIPGELSPAVVGILDLSALWGHGRSMAAPTWCLRSSLSEFLAARHVELLE
jgi:glycerate kinase